MAPLALAFLVLPTFQAEPVRIDLAGYAPSYLPPVLNNRAPKKSEALTCSTRGYRDIMIEWEIRMPQEHMELELKEAFKIPNLGYTDTGGRWHEFNRQDRSVLISTQPGRIVMTSEKIDGFPVGRVADSSTYTTVTCFEYVLPVGPLPKDWPEKARQAISVPKDAPRMPIPGFDGQPDEVTFNKSAIGTWYHLAWYVNEPRETAYPKWLKVFEGLPDWKVVPDKNATEIYGSGPRAGQTITLNHYNNTNRPVPPDWSGIELRWLVKPRD